MSARDLMNAAVPTVALTRGYTIDLEYCGYGIRQYVVRQYGDWVGRFETIGKAEHEIEIVRGGSLPS